MNYIPQHLIKLLFLPILFLVSCSSVRTISTSLQKGELQGTLAIAPATTATQESEPEAGAFAVYLQQQLQQNLNLQTHLLASPSSRQTTTAQTFVQAGRRFDADWVLVPTIMDQSVAVNRELTIDSPIYVYDHDSCCSSCRRGRNNRHCHRSRYLYHAPTQYEASTRSTRRVQLALQLYSTKDNRLVWVGEGNITLSRTRRNHSQYFIPTSPDTPTPPRTADALRILAKDTGKELLELSPQ